MAKVIKAVALVAVGVALVVFAAPIAGALVGAFAAAGVTVAAAAITSAIVGIGLSLGVSAVLGIFRKPPSLPASTTERLSQSINATAPRKIVFGRTAGGQDIRYYEATYNSKKDRTAMVVALASHRLNAILAFYVEDKVAWQGAVIKDGLLSFRAVNEGTPSNGAAVGSGKFWDSSATFTGCAYVALDWTTDTKRLPQGIPANTKFIVEGCPLYDPRRDTSRGGSGAHRADNQATWQFITDGVEIGRNPALALLTYLIGWRVNGKLMWGMGVPLSRINLDNFRVYANLCEERVSIAAGGTIQRYTVDGIFSTSDTHESIMSALSAAMGSCKLNDVGGQYQLVGGYDDTAGPKQAFDDRDIVSPVGSATPYLWVPSPSLTEKFNIVTGRFADPAALYQLNSWGTIETEVEADGVPRTMTLDLGAVNRAETCQRIAKQFLLREAKTPGIFTATFNAKAFAVQVGSLVTLSIAAQGWNNKLFRVTAQSETHDLLFQMTLREESPEVYAWDREEKPLPFSIRPPGYDPQDTLPVLGLSLNTRTYQGVN